MKFTSKERVAMTKAVRELLRVGCALLVVAGAASLPARADCQLGIDPPLLFGNIGFEHPSWFLVDPAAAGAFYGTYIFQNPEINQGPVPLDQVVFDNSAFTGPGTSVAVGDWSAGQGFTGCPYSLETSLDKNMSNENVWQVFFVGDPSGVSVVIAGAGVDVDFNPFFFNFDASGPGWLTGGGPFLKTTPDMLTPMVTGAVTGSSVTVNLQWRGVAVNADSGSRADAARLVGYQVFERRMRGTTLISNLPVADTDQNPFDTGATVVLTQEDGVTSTLSVAAGLAGSAGQPALPLPILTGGDSSPILLTPGLATPTHPRGRGKGLEKAPGQNR